VLWRNNSLHPKQQRDKKSKYLKGVNYASIVLKTKNKLKLSQNALSLSFYSRQLFTACMRFSVWKVFWKGNIGWDTNIG
jgi:hypothetical protein